MIPRALSRLRRQPRAFATRLPGVALCCADCRRRGCDGNRSRAPALHGRSSSARRWPRCGRRSRRSHSGHRAFGKAHSADWHRLAGHSGVCQLLQVLDGKTIALLASSVFAVLLAGRMLAPVLGINHELALIAASSVAICGASAAVAFGLAIARLETRDRDIACTVGAVSVISTLAMLLYPLIARHLGFAAMPAGVFLGVRFYEGPACGRGWFRHGHRHGQCCDCHQALACRHARASSHAGHEQPFTSVGRGRPFVPLPSLVPYWICGFRFSTCPEKCPRTPQPPRGRSPEFAFSWPWPELGSNCSGAACSTTGGDRLCCSCCCLD